MPPTHLLSVSSRLARKAVDFCACTNASLSYLLQMYKQLRRYVQPLPAVAVQGQPSVVVEDQSIKSLERTDRNKTSQAGSSTGGA
jgi:hypothetical protein